MDFCRLKIQCTEIDFYNNIFQKSSTDQEGDRYVVCNMFHNITKSMHVYGVAKVSLHWDDKRDPPLDHRVLDQRWISGRFLVDCSDSELFFHASAWYDKFSDCIYVIQCLFLDDILTYILDIGHFFHTTPPQGPLF